MLKEVITVLELTQEDLFWLTVLLICIVLWALAEAIYRRVPEWESVTTKDENGNEITKISRIKK